MAYFSNGDEGIFFRAENCDLCIHDNMRDFEDGGNKPPCPIEHLHLEWNYDQNKDGELGKVKKFALDLLIPDPGPTQIPKCPFKTVVSTVPDADGQEVMECGRGT